MDVSAAARAAAREPDVMISADVWRALVSNAQHVQDSGNKEGSRDA